MKKVTEKSLQNLWDYCNEAYDDNEIANNFFRHVDQLLGRGDVDFDLVMDFIRANGIKRVKPDTRAKTVNGPGPLYSPEYREKKLEKVKRNPTIPKRPRGGVTWPWRDPCGQSSGSRSSC